MSHINVKNLECLCVKDVAAKSVTAQGDLFKAKISCTSNLRTSRSYNFGKISSTKMISDEEFRYRITPPVGSNLNVDSQGPIYRIYLQSTLNFEKLPRMGDIVVLKDSEDVEYRYKVFEYRGKETAPNGTAIHSLDIEFLLGQSLVDVPVSQLCNSVIGYTCVATLKHEFPFQSDPVLVYTHGLKSKLDGVVEVGGKLSGRIGLPISFMAIGEIESGVMTASYSVKQKVEGTSSLRPTFLDKFAGSFGDYKCVEKLYPSGDIALDSGMQSFVGPSNEKQNLYTFIDEGVFTGDYHKPWSQSVLLADDKNSFIHPSGYHTEGIFQYKSELTGFHIRPDQTRLRVRASAPMSNYESKIAPLYTIRNVTFSDPSGNVMVQYEDINILGDVDYSNDKTFVNYATYSLKPTANKFADQYDWERRSQPHAHQTSGYLLSFDVKVTPRDDAFDGGYDVGFEEDHVMHITHAGDHDYLGLDGAPLSSQAQSLINPTKGLRISAIEICNSGGEWLSSRTGPRREDYFSLFLDVPQNGRRLEKKILPSFFALADVNNSGIFPAVSSIWQHKNAITSSMLGDNLDICGSEQIVKILQVDSSHDYAELHSTGPHFDSGKMIVKFGYGHGPVNEIRQGAFGDQFDQSTSPIWFQPSGAFQTETKVRAGFDNNFLAIESITLKIKAKKAADSRDYVLDVVGWSDDKLLNVTKAPSGFLQNPSSVKINGETITSEGTHPVISGYYDNDDDLATSARSMSEREKYLETSGNLGGDHYSLTRYPIVNTTEFTDYEVPLKIYKDDVELGLSRNYNVSSMLEHLYLDIYPLPSGAAIASAHLLVRYAPQSALQLEIQGGECLNKIQDGRSEGKIFPTTKQGGDSIINAGSGYGPLSTITSIPHTYSTPSSIKSNYSRRWRGLEGTVQGPYDTDAFSFGFNNPLLEFPLLSGFYNFDYMDGKYGQSKPLGAGFGGVSGLFNSTPEIYKNIGWRFKTQDIFDTNAPNHTSSYKTTDWTALSSTSPSHNFEGHELYGMIADAFDNAVRISGHNQNINFGNVDASGGFSIFTRFTPDIDVSGTTYDLFQSGVLFSKWSSPSDMDFALGYSGGYLCGYAKATNGTVVTVEDTVKYSGYQYPLSVILTYNDHESQKLKLYTDNELHSGVWTTLRASSNTFTKHTNSANLIVGHSAGSGVGMNMLLAEFGISTWNSGVYGSGTNIVETNADATYRQVTAQKFLENHRVKFFEPGEPSSNDTYKLWDYVNEDPQDWTIGDFRYKAFGLGFSHLTKRSGKDLINFHLRSSGIPYQNQSGVSLASWPSTVSSGVSYHTQIENDFLRFHLSDTSDNFHSVAKRITKSLPIGYNFKEEALVVETILEHRSSGNIRWPECQPTTFHLCNEHKHAHQDHYAGPRLVVSLYTKKKEPYWVPNEDNWGLINRAIHYVEQASGITRLDSKFNYQNLLDESEQWALFPREPRLTEFTEKYYSQDVDDMFLQYDLVYPSGGQFDSNIDVHSAHVRMDDAFVKCTPNSGIFNLMASGGNVIDPKFNLFTEGLIHKNSGILNLNTFGPVLLPASGFELNISGSIRQDDTLPLRTIAVAIASGQPEFPLHTYGRSNVVVGASGTFNLMTNGKGLSTIQMPLSITNDGLVITPSGGELPLYTYAPSGGSTGYFQQMQLRVENSLGGSAYPSSGTIPVYILGSAPLVDRLPSISMPLVVVNNQFVSSGTLNLTVYGDDGVTSQVSSSGVGEAVGVDGSAQIGMNLYLPNYGGIGSTYLRWYNHNYGTGIQLRDNEFAAIPVSNEIRGVDLIGYGACDSDSPRKAIDPPLMTDETIWRPETCNDGGIFRAINTYTNSGAINFAGETGYAGNYYGFRKYTGLIPHAPYYSTLKITTGSTDPIEVPRDFEDWEYGICGPDFYLDSGCCGADCDQNLTYSGVKLIGDYPYLSGNLSITPESGRNPFDNFGETVAVTDDLMVVGSPKIEIPDTSGYAVPDAGSLFLYRRGQNVAGKKASWTMEDRLMLPSGFRRDYVDKTVENLLEFDQFTISGRKWNIGQEGRMLGSSVDVATSGDRETIVTGAPFARWSRQFEDIVVSGVPSCMVIFVDKYKYDVPAIAAIGNAGKRWEHLYKYFSAPWNAQTPNEFQPELNVKCLVIEIANQDKKKIKHPEDFKDFFTHTYIPRMDDQKLIDEFGARNTYNSMLSGIIGAFKDMFSPRTSWSAFEPHSGIPPIVGIFKEHSNSTLFGKAFQLDNEDVVNDFVDFYKEYSYASGTVNPEVPVPISGHTRIELGQSENFQVTAVDLMNSTLDSGYLMNTNIENTPYPLLSVITSGVGQKWAKSNSTEFQIPPSSGGRVFVFEKESGKFNCIQEIIPYSERNAGAVRDNDQVGDEYLGYGSQYNDRFGHSVAISKNSQIISIGSPWTYVPCEIFERQDTENQRMYAGISGWLNYRNLDIPLARYDTLALESGLEVANKETYHELSQTNKFWLRTDRHFWDDKPIELYKPIFNYKYGDIGAVGTWQFIPGEFLGSSRLGYSTSASDDGTTVAFGAPTDSTTLFEDTNVWYNRGAKEATFASYTNAGAVRIFESRQFVSHSGAVEYTRFGNLDRSVHSELREAGFYDRMGAYFQPDNIPFERLPFSELDISPDTGLAFIITPELDAASDEIIDNIKSWLALGDRTLVLVGNDPLYEENGLYRESNDVVNKILKKLGSRMRIVAADTKYESLPECVNEADVFADRWNVTKSLVPDYAYTEGKTGVQSKHTSPNMFAKGVGKIVYDMSNLGLEDLFVSSPCDELNPDVCNLPLKHLGDPRSQWATACVDDNGKLIKYTHNWPFHFGNTNPSAYCLNPPKTFVNRPHEDVVPILTAAEFLPDQYWYSPKIEKCITECKDIWEYYDVPQFYKECKFASHQLEAVAFSVSGDFNGQTVGESMEYWRIGNNKGGFIDPAPVNGRDAILKGIGAVKEKVTIVDKAVILDDKSALMVEEPYLYKNDEGEDIDANNRVFILASVNGETSESFTDGDGNDDQNIIFYINAVKKNCEETGRLVQLGGWTKRTSFGEQSLVKEKLTAFGFDVTENATYEPGVDIDGTETVDTVWIANPAGLPADDDIILLKNWLKNGNKKLFITYAGWHKGERQELAENVSVLLEKLGLESRPWLRPCKGDYYVHGGEGPKLSNKQECCPFDPNENPAQKLSSDSDVFTGCTYGYGWNKNYNSQDKTVVQKLSLKTSSEGCVGDCEVRHSDDFIPISGGGNYKNLIWYEYPVMDTCPEVSKENLWYLDCKASGQFPVHPGSGYRVFVNWVSETKSETYGAFGVVENALNADEPCPFVLPQPPCDCQGISSYDPNKHPFPQRNLRNNCSYSEGNHHCGCQGDPACGNCRLDTTTLGNPSQSYVDVKADETGKLRVIFDTEEYKENIWIDDCKGGFGGHDPAKGYPQTARILSISGCLLPIEEEILSKPKRKRRLIGKKCTESCTTIPATSGVIRGAFRAISHPSEEYCDSSYTPCAPRGDTEIEDGPIIAAEEYEHFSDGKSGHERSKIVLLTDSTMIQGQCEHYRNDSIGENQDFIRNLYPLSSHVRATGELVFSDVVGSLRQFQFTQKLRAPERGSAPKYYAAKSITNTLLPLYGANGNGTVDEFVDNEDTYHPTNPGFDRPADPTTSAKIEAEIKYFGNTIYSDYGGYPRFSGDFLNQLPTKYIIDGKEKDFLVDADAGGGVNDLMKVADGKDYLDFDFYNSGCPGDLFGFSVDLSNNKLIVGTPFNGLVTENVASGVSGIVQWHEIANDPFRSGVVVSQNGGAGAAFYFERTGKGKNVASEKLAWEFMQKIKPSSINVGIDGANISTLQTIKGDHDLNADFAVIHGGRTDKFGYSVAIDADMIAIGAPHHDYETLHDHIYSGAVVANNLNTAFQRKSFSVGFDIPSHKFYDLGNSGVRVDDFDTDSGTMVLNHGAVFNYRHSMTNWGDRTKEWIYGEKLFSHGYHARSGSIYIGDNLAASGCENDSFGRSVSIFRSERGDSDYTLAVGSPFHDHATSGNHISSGVTDAGAAYTYDAMLRGQDLAIPMSGSWIDVKIFGAKTLDGMNMLSNRVYQNKTGDSITYLTSGLVYSNSYGDLYIEASGFDPAVKGFIAHRPFVESVVGNHTGGESANGSLNLITTGKPIDISGTMNLMLSGAPSADVYNSMNLRTFGVSGTPSGDMPLYVAAPSGSSNQSLNLNVTSTQTTENLNLRTRGK